ncbi:VOC family protein [Panacibacter ginsenosidivorans]|uniref:VOC family protein n=1 Tax=Panacibacter ginsenosidivorans TaxID=1813871 RepID=A0A5B8V6G7_9BACT|nr:VOC family protein [Panacibacter ginsenosidivorans]QEC66799.1 VOC family protein [Panacibacter ginsenosidivorans]
MQKITPFLWFDGRAEEAVNFYASVFKNSKVTSIKHWGEGSPFPKDQVMSATVELEGLKFHAFDAGPQFKFTEAISFFVDCENQAEVDYFWGKLSEGGEKSRCGWLKDKFGVSWQIVPKTLGELLGNRDTAKAKRAMAALMQMDKIIIADLENA